LKGDEVMVKEKPTVRIQRKVSKRRYPRWKETYTYERFYIDIPEEFHDKFEPFLNQELDVEVRQIKDGLEITCAPRENVSAPRKHLEKATD
jgi:hypothetical protein